RLHRIVFAAGIPPRSVRYRRSASSRSPRARKPCRLVFSCVKRRDFYVVSAHNAGKTGQKPYLRGTQRREPSLSDESRRWRFGRKARISAVSAVTVVAAAAGTIGATVASAAPAKPAGAH